MINLAPIPGSFAFGQVDANSTATAFTATVPGVAALYDGLCVYLRNNVITSASGWTLNINGLGAKPVYSTLSDASRITTAFNKAYTMLFVYNESRVSGGCWDMFYGMDTNTNTIGYQLRTASAQRPAKTRGYRYRLWFTGFDGKHWVPANESSSTNATAARTPSDEVIDPFGEIVYNSTNGTVEANANLPVGTCWEQYTLALGYSFNKTGAALALLYPAPVYVKCQPQTGGGVVMKDYTQTLPSTDDGYVYLFLGMAYSATNIELFPTHPCYFYKDGAIRIWTNAAENGSTIDPATDAPRMDGTAAVGTSTKYAREDHVHPHDTKIPDTASISDSGLITFKNGNTSLFTLQLPIYTPTASGGEN